MPDIAVSTKRSRTVLSAAALAVGAVAGIAVMVMLVRLLPRDPDTAGLGLNTAGAVEPHPRGDFHFQDVSARRFAESAKHLGASRTVLWLGASQIYGINAYRPGQRNVAYRVFDSLIGEGTAVMTVSFALASPQEHDLILQDLIGTTKLSGLIIGAAFGDMRHEGMRAGLMSHLEDPGTRARMEQTEQGRQLVAQTLAERRPTPVQRSDSGSSGLMESVEGGITDRLQAMFGLEDFRHSGRAWLLLGLQEIRRTIESLRARYTRDLSMYRIPMSPQGMAANWAAWRHMLATAKAQGIPALVYIAPRPGDFFPFDPAAYDAFKRDLARLAAEYGAAFVNIEDTVPVASWGTVDIGFGFYARDPFHFTAEGHKLMAEALLPHIRRHLLGRAAP